MPSGLVALLDDVAGIAKLAAASLDDVGAAAGKASSKALGVVVDDAAVTPRYVVGLSPDRELPIIGRIALGSLRNKLLILLPIALLLSAFAPWALTPLLMIGGAFLCFEGAEKVIEAIVPHAATAAAPIARDAKAVEDEKVSSAIKTDFILSAEIMAIALADVAASPILTQGIVLAIVAIGITVGVYGVVGLIVKVDDIGLNLAARPSAAVRKVGRGLVKGMPVVMRLLTIVGTAAMLWVGGGIVLHGVASFGLGVVPHTVEQVADLAGHAIPFASGAVEWIVNATAAGLLGVVLGGLIAWVVHLVPHKAAH